MLIHAAEANTSQSWKHCRSQSHYQASLNAVGEQYLMGYARLWGRREVKNISTAELCVTLK